MVKAMGVTHEVPQRQCRDPPCRVIDGQLGTYQEPIICLSYPLNHIKQNNEVRGGHPIILMERQCVSYLNHNVATREPSRPPRNRWPIRDIARGNNMAFIFT